MSTKDGLIRVRVGWDAAVDLIITSGGSTKGTTWVAAPNGSLKT